MGTSCKQCEACVGSTSVCPIHGPSLAASTQFDGSKALMATDALAAVDEKPMEQGRPDDHGSASRESDGKAATDKEKRDSAVDAFAEAIKARLDQKAAKGFTGWDGAYPSDALGGEIADDACTVERAMRKCVDIGARAMMLHYRSSNKATSNAGKAAGGNQA